MTTQKTDQTRQDRLNMEERQATKRPFVEPEVSGPIDVLEATAFFVVFTGDTSADTGIV